jgi:hypothetical protein
MFHVKLSVFFMAPLDCPHTAKHAKELAVRESLAIEFDKICPFSVQGMSPNAQGRGVGAFMTLFSRTYAKNAPDDLWTGVIGHGYLPS